MGNSFKQFEELNRIRNVYEKRENNRISDDFRRFCERRGNLIKKEISSDESEP